MCEHIPKMAILYIILSVVYFVVIFLQNPTLLHEPKRWMIIDFLFNGSYYHLWYMLGILYSIVIILFFCKLKAKKFLLPIALMCYAVGLLGTSYYGIGCKIPVLKTLYSFGYFDFIRRVLFMGFPFMVLGWTISENKFGVSLTKRQLMFITIIVALVFVGENIIVTLTGLSRNVVITIFLFPLLFLIFNLCLAHPLTRLTNTASYCRKVANFIYYWHPIAILILSKYLTDSLLLFVVVTTLCLLSGSAYYMLRLQWRKRT